MIIKPKPASQKDFIDFLKKPVNKNKTAIKAAAAKIIEKLNLKLANKTPKIKKPAT